MYRQGLGDCFLLTFNGDSPRHMLIDFGVILGTPSPESKLLPVARHIARSTQGQIDTLVITHEHLDHVWGFHEKMTGKVFVQDIAFKRLWMAWTEDPHDRLAATLRREREQKREAALRAAAALSGMPGLAAAQAKRIADMLGFFGIDKNDIAAARPRKGRRASTRAAKRQSVTQVAFDRMKETIDDKTYFQPGTGPFPVPDVPGIRFYVLGPPRSRQQIFKSRVTAKDDVFELGGGLLSVADSMFAALNSETERGQPFQQHHRLRRTDRAVKTARSRYDSEPWRQVEENWLGIGEQLALALDDATNNTSLVLAFELVDTGEVLLFVGDAQLGNWYSWDDHEWEAKDADGDLRKIRAADLLNRTVFYKVGHHGSHNATLREKGLERMTSNKLVAMVPVNVDVAHNVKGWKRMPLPSLCDRLREKAACYIQQDEAESVHGALNGRVQCEKWFVDYYVG